MNSAFFYIDGVPTKGAWIDLESDTTHEEILETLAESGFIGRDEEGNPQYDGDLMVADVEGDLARAFLSKSGSFDLDGFTEALGYCEDNHVPEEAVAAYIEDRGSWSRSDFEDAYCGEYESELDYAQRLVDDCGYLDDMPESLRYYFDYEKFARDLFISDYTFLNGFVFRN